ncbi:Peroxyureidoacrylate/ureidoacrylate amidohydrolase RutB [Cladophialophora carrionii]|uniref:Peroxyureidoacrylate/ureidoacrylate amidohydrolase RutB n=1 Tax=Cladophialophora carrionii TaxID=86049 RepID=A0A1C1CCS3_9EURO|nr:Peroxyureidoacrylate/ureidoacrylate amidohydrolase RutB [Cladophialophora carrionii]
MHSSLNRSVLAEPYHYPHDASFSPATTAIVVIDMQRDFCEIGGYFDCQGCGVEDARNLIPTIQALLSAARRAGFPVFFTREGHRPDLSTLSSRERFRSRKNPRQLGIGDRGPLGRFLVRGEPGHDVIPELEPRPDEVIIDKPGRGAFAHTDFELLLKMRGIRNLVLCGVTTDVCVSTTMREANDRGFDCLLLEDATAAATPQLHNATIESVKMEGGIFGAVAQSGDVIGAITRDAAQPRE